MVIFWPTGMVSVPNWKSNSPSVSWSRLPVPMSPSWADPVAAALPADQPPEAADNEWSTTVASSSKNVLPVKAAKAPVPIMLPDPP